MKRKLWIIPMLVLLFAVLWCGAAMAESSGKLNDSISWTLTDDGLLKISGTGAIPDYGSVSSPFEGDMSIKKAVFQNGITHIGSSLFEDCGNLTEISLNNRIESIGANAFYHTGLKKVSLSDIAFIGFGAFCDCDSLTEVTLSSEYGFSKKVAVDGYAFSDCDSLTSVTIYAGVESLGEYAFLYCEKLAEVTILDAEVTFGEDVFYGCAAGLSITGWAESTAEAYADAEGFDFVSLGTASGTCGDHVTWSLNATATTLKISGTGATWSYPGEYPVFYNARGRVKTIEISEGLTELGGWLFFGMDSVTSVQLPDSLTGIGRQAFGQCSLLSRITIPSAVTSIANSAFGDCSSLVSAGIHNLSAEIGNDVFNGCKAGMKIWCYPDSTAETYAKANGIAYGNYPVVGTCGDSVVWALNPKTGKLTITGTGPMAHFDHSAPWADSYRIITSVEVKSGVTSVAEYSFGGCYHLTAVSLPDGITSIGDFAFNGCEALTAIRIPNGVKSIGEWAFFACYQLADVELPYTLETIDEHAFRACKSLTEITLPRSVKVISNAAFIICENLESVTVYNPKAVFGSGVFGSCSSNLIIHGWAGSTAQSEAPENGFEALAAPVPALFLPSNLTQIEEDAFTGISAPAVVIPKTVKSISGDPFAKSGVVCIYGYFGSAAQALASKYDYPFITIDDAWMASHKK